MKVICNYCFFIAVLLFPFSGAFSQSTPDVDGGNKGQHQRPDVSNPNRDRQRPDHAGNKKGSRGSIANQMQAKRNLYIMRRLDLTQADSEKFFPIYQKCQMEWNEMKMKSRVPLMQGIQNDKDNSKTPLKESEKLKLLENEMSMQQQKIDLMKKYNEEYKKVIPSIKIALLYQAEDMFVEEQMMRSMRSEDGPRGH